MNINLLKAQIALKGRKVKDVAKVLNISKSTVYRRLNGKNNFARQEICKLITCLEIESNRGMAIFLMSQYLKKILNVWTS